MFFKFPYVDMYTLNLDWMIKYLEETKASLEQWQTIIDNLGTIVHSVNGQTGDVNLGTLVNSVNGQTGNVNLGTLVNSVNGKTGNVEIDNDDINALKIELVLQTTDPASTFTPAVVTPLFNSGIRFIIINNKEFYSITEAGAMIRFNPFEDLNISKELAQPPANQAEIEALYNQGIRFIRYTVSDIVKTYALEKIDSVVVAYDLDGTNGANLFNFIDSNETIEDYSLATLQTMYSNGIRFLFQDEINGTKKFYVLLGTEVDGYTGYQVFDPISYFDNQFVPSLQNDISELKSTIQISGKASTGNALIPFTKGAYYPTSPAGTVVSNPVSSDIYEFCKIPCAKNDTFYVNLYAGSGVNRAYAILDSNNTVLYRTTRIDNQTSGTITVDFDDASYIVFNNNTVQNPVGSVISGTPIVNRVATLETIVENKQNTLTFDEIPRYASINPVLSKGIYQFSIDSKNALEKINNLQLITDFVYNKAYNTSGDSIIIDTPDTASSFRCAIIACQSGDAFALSGNGSTSYKPWAFVDANGTILSKETKNTSGLITIVAPENAAYFIFNTTIAYNGFCAKGSINSIINYYSGKKINWIGDSIVAGADFDEMVTSDMNMIETDYGIGGSTISLKGDGTNARNAVCLRYTEMADDADIIAVSAGTNDFEYAWSPIGTIESTENTTFYGALKTLCEGLITKYPEKVIFFTTPIKRAQPFEDGNGGEYTPDGVTLTPYSKNKYGLTLKDYANIIKEVCGYYSIPVLDLYSESMLNPHIVAQQGLFDTLLTHPTHYGRLMMAKRVKGWLLQLAY